MKKLFIGLMLCVAMSATAKDDTKYLAGAVPEVNGMVTFTKSFTVADKSAQEVRQTMQQFVNDLVENSIPAPGNYARVMEDSEEGIVARVCEWMVFKKKPMYLDRTRFRYQIKVQTQGNRVTLIISTISYYYAEDMEGEGGTLFKAEEWISDREALNKSKTKLYPKSGKFRRKTVDRAEEIFDAAMDAFEEKEEPVVPVKKVRKGIVED